MGVEWRGEDGRSEGVKYALCEGEVVRGRAGVLERGTWLYRWTDGRGGREVGE